MPQDADFRTYVTLASLDQPNVQNVQELAGVWGTIRGEFEELGVELLDDYAALGERDVVLVYEAPDGDAAFEAEVVLHRHGFDVETMEVTDTDHFADLVTDG